MNIKRYIKEEMDDFEWMKNTNPLSTEDFVIIKFNDKNISNSDIDKVFNMVKDVLSGENLYLFKQQLNRIVNYIRESKETYIKLYIDKLGDKVFTYGSKESIMRKYLWVNTEYNKTDTNKPTYFEVGVNELLKLTMNESVGDMDWIEDMDFQFTEDMVKSLMSNCKTIKVATLRKDKDEIEPHVKIGKENTHVLSMCEDLWEKYPNHGWLKDREPSDYVIVLNDNGGPSVTFDVSQVLGFLNGFDDEMWFIVDEKHRPNYDLIPKKYHKQIKDKYEPLLREGDEFDWIRDVPSGDLYRYFDINVCYNSFYDEDTCEDECTDGGSYFIKIPAEVVPEIWDYEAEDYYIAGPVDEGLDVIEWCLDNDLLDDTDFVDVEYVTEITKNDYCRSWGKWDDEDKEMCEEIMTEK